MKNSILFMMTSLAISSAWSSPFVGYRGNDVNTGIECGQYVSGIAKSWNWHYPRETPTIRAGNKPLQCKNGRGGYLYTSDSYPGQYFVADNLYRRRTQLYRTPCDAVAEYCNQDIGRGGSITNGRKPPARTTPPGQKTVYCSVGKASWVYKPGWKYHVFRAYTMTPHQKTQLRRDYILVPALDRYALNKKFRQVQASGKMEYLGAMPARAMCTEWKHNCHTAEPFVSELCGSLRGK